MPNSLEAYRQEMLNRVNDPDGFGRVEAITGLSAQTITVGTFGVGSVSATKYLQKWLYRPETASTADLTRMCSAFTPATGVLTHAGIAYADTTVGTEHVEVHEYEPKMLNSAINLALQRLRRRDIETIPTTGSDRYWLGQFSWVNEPGDVELVKYSSNPVLSRNRYFQKWNSATPDVANTVGPDWWTLSGTAATVARITTNVYRPGQYGVQVVAGGAAVSEMSQSVGQLADGVSGDAITSKIVTVVVVGRATAASALRGWYSDDGGTTKQYTTYHAGTSLQAELSLQVTVLATASNPTFGWEQAAASTCQVSQCYLVRGALSDGVRKNSYDANEIPKQWDESAGPGALILQTPTAYGAGGTIEVHSKRSYPTLTLDSDTADAPLAQIAVGALYLLYRGLAARHGVDVTQYAQERERWLRAYAPLAGKHYNSEWGGYGADWKPALLNPFPLRLT